MIQMVEMDAAVTLADQVRSTAEGPVVLINKFNVAADEAEALLAAWREDSHVMKRQPGFISAQLHRGLEGSGVFVNVAVWESVAAFRNAFGNPEFQSKLGHYPASAVASPHLFRRVAVDNVCTA